MKRGACKRCVSLGYKKKDDRFVCWKMGRSFTSLRSMCDEFKAKKPGSK